MNGFRRFTLIISISLTLAACRNQPPSPTLTPTLSLTPIATATDIPSVAAQTSHKTFSLTGEQAQEVAVFISFIRAFNNGRLDEALGLLAKDVTGSDCDYEKVSLTFFKGKAEAAEWLRQRFADRDQLVVSGIYNENPDPRSGKHVIGVEYSRRKSLTLERLGFLEGITPNLASKVVFRSEPSLIQGFANGPGGGDLDFCRP
jgi:hypothetical protein